MIPSQKYYWWLFLRFPLKLTKKMALSNKQSNNSKQQINIWNFFSSCFASCLVKKATRKLAVKQKRQTKTVKLKMIQGHGPAWKLSQKLVYLFFLNHPEGSGKIMFLCEHLWWLVQFISALYFCGWFCTIATCLLWSLSTCSRLLWLTCTHLCSLEIQNSRRTKWPRPHSLQQRWSLFHC